jgi:chloramphenicol O-acetyltransferase type A
MNYIDMDKWNRKAHFDFFHRMDYPQFNLCMNIDVTHFLDCTRSNRLSFYYSMIYAATKAANETEEFRCRIRNDRVILHEKVHPSFTDTAQESDLFKFVTVDMKEGLAEFVHYAKEESGKQEDYFNAGGDRDDLLYITCIPWITFTSLSHTISLRKDDSVPRISWGRYFNEGGKVLLPFSVQANHALMDGLHVARYVERLEAYINSL